jgi:hypothetical protein
MNRQQNIEKRLVGYDSRCEIVEYKFNNCSTSDIKSRNSSEGN